MIGFQEVDGFLPFGEPEFGLGHGMCFPFTNNTASQRALGYRWASGRDSSDGCWEGYGGGLQTGWRDCGGCPYGAWTAAGCGLSRC